MTTQHTPPSRVALVVVGLVALACIALAGGASFITGQLREINRDNIEIQRIAIEATKEASRIKDAADARRETVQAHGEGVNQGMLAVVVGASVGFALVVGTLAFALKAMTPKAWDA